MLSILAEMLRGNGHLPGMVQGGPLGGRPVLLSHFCTPTSVHTCPYVGDNANFLLSSLQCGPHVSQPGTYLHESFKDQVCCQGVSSNID